jgi:hypothetical protein
MTIRVRGPLRPAALSAASDGSGSFARSACPFRSNAHRRLRRQRREVDGGTIAIGVDDPAGDFKQRIEPIERGNEQADPSAGRRNCEVILESHRWHWQFGMATHLPADMRVDHVLVEFPPTAKPAAALAYLDKEVCRERDDPACDQRVRNGMQRSTVSPLLFAEGLARSIAGIALNPS